eukprot:10685_1
MFDTHVKQNTIGCLCIASSLPVLFPSHIRVLLFAGWWWFMAFPLVVSCSFPFVFASTLSLAASCSFGGLPACTSVVQLRLWLLLALHRSFLLIAIVVFIL